MTSGPSVPEIVSSRGLVDDDDDAAGDEMSNSDTPTGGLMVIKTSLAGDFFASSFDATSKGMSSLTET